MNAGFVLATAQYPVYRPESWDHFERTLSAWVEEAVRNDARLLLFPEYASMVLTGLLSTPLQADLHGQIAALQAFRDDYVALHRRLAQQHGVYIVAGSLPWRQEDGTFLNRSWICGPDGRCDYQDKLVMTRFEREEWHIGGGTTLKLFQTALGRLAINICYDVEFPLLARAQAEAGAELILAPSCTDTLGGYHRVRTGCAARALENQCFAVQSPLVGDAPWSPAIDVNRGAAAVFGPPDRGFPDDGIVAAGALDQAGWVYATIDLARVAQVRDQGQVYNHRHWSDQLPAPTGPYLQPVSTVIV